MEQLKKMLEDILKMPAWEDLLMVSDGKEIKKKLLEMHDVMCSGKEDDGDGMDSEDSYDDIEDMYEENPKIKDKNMATYIIARMKVKK